MISFAWEFPALDVAHQSGEFENVVTALHWRFIAVDGDATDNIYGSVALQPPGQPFTDYELLTPQIVQGWAESALGEARVEQMRTSLTQSLLAQAGPASTTTPPPWQSKT